MSKRDDVPDLKRRNFFKGATLAGAAALSAPFDAAAQNAAPRAGVAPPNRAAETGTVAQGGGGRTGGLRIAQMPIPFAAFLSQLRHPANEMPPYVSAVLSDQDAADIYAYIASLPPPPDVKTIPALND